MKLVEELWKMGIYGCLLIVIVLTGREMLRRHLKKYSCVLWILTLFCLAGLCVRTSFTDQEALMERECRMTGEDCRVCYLLNLDGMKGLGHSALLLINEEGYGSVFSYNGMQYGLLRCLTGKEGIGKMTEYRLDPEEVEILLNTGDLEADNREECDNFDRMLYRRISDMQYEQIRYAAGIYIEIGNEYEQRYAAIVQAEETQRAEKEAEMENFLQQDLPRYQIYTHNCDTVARELLALVDDEIRLYNEQEQKLTPKGNYKNMCIYVSDQWGIARLGKDSLVEWILDF